MAVVEVWSVLEWNGCDIFGDRHASLQYTLYYGGGPQRGWRWSVTLDGPASGVNALSGINRSQGPGRSVMFTGSPRTRAEVLNEAPARAARRSTR